MVDHFTQDGLDRDETARMPRTRLGDLKDFRFSLVQQGLSILPGRRQRAGRDLITDADQLSKDGPLPDDLGVATDIGSRWCVVGDFPQVGKPPGLLSFPALFQRFKDRKS